MKVCILAIANPLHWVGPYVRAFRRVADVLTVGPPFGMEFLNGLGLPGRTDLLCPNDIETPLGRDVDLAALLPEGWRPDLIVAISNFGRSLSPQMNGLDCPKVYLSIDTWQSPLDFLDALHYDYVFAAQRVFVPHLEATGSRNVHWLPLACDPELHHPTGAESTADISFAGAIAPSIHDERTRLLGVLGERFTIHRASNVYGEDYCAAIGAGVLTFNHAAVNDLNMRIFEAPAMGVPLLTNRASDRNGLSELFTHQEHLLIYDNDVQLLAFATEYLADPQAARALAERARREVLARHTYDHRVAEILARVSEGFQGFPGTLPTPSGGDGVWGQYIPRDSRRILDMGMGLSEELAGFRQRGLTYCVGCAPQDNSGQGAWDDYKAWSPQDETPVEVDTVVISRMSAFDEEPDTIFSRALHHLCAGGFLVIRLSEVEWQNLVPDNDTARLVQQFLAMDGHLRNIYLDVLPGPRPSQVYTLCVRKRRRPLLDVVEEGLSTIPVAYNDALDWVRKLAPNQ